jgi:tetratricopeptide (TPR) repeat protein
MARKYYEAQFELEETLYKVPNSKPIKKKLIVCYTQTGKINKALDFFYDLLSEDVDIIANTDPVLDDCPCYELVEEIEKLNIYEENSRDFYVLQGIIWSYCDIEKALNFFEAAKSIDPKDSRIHGAIKRINEYLLKQNKN